jgi:carboxyl-terminal processing protease
VRNEASLVRHLKRLACALALWLAACGGGDGGIDGGGGLSCSIGDQQVWLRDNFDRNYFWYALSPKPAPGSALTVEAYFDDLLYGGGDLIPGGGGATWPFDRYSYFQSTESFERIFGAGQTLGWGVAVNGLEAVRANATRLFVRYIEPLSPAAQTGAIAGGLLRGDEIVAINGTPVATFILADDFSALSAVAESEQLRLDVRRGAGPVVTVILNAAIFALTPVQRGQVVASFGTGRKMGYVFVKDMIDQVQPTLGTTMTSFRNQGVQDLVIDMRYNGGGFVSVGRDVASYAAGSRGANQTYARLLYNDKNAGSNQSFAFTNPNAWSGFSRVYVLMGERTCSASEQVINGLRGVGVDVVAIGDITCGKPVGFNARDDGCGTTYSIVNFESVNALNQGRYFDGFAPTCSVAEDFSKPIGALDDPLLVAAAYHVDNGVCPAGTAREQALSKLTSTPRKRYGGADGGERTGMQAR